MLIARDYFISQSKVLQSNYEASKTVHPGDTGANREAILVEWLMQHLPKSTFLKVGGNIIDSTGHVTNQIDIVFCNDSAPRFGGQLKSYFFAEGVIAAVQVKSKLTSGELASAVNNLDTAKKCKINKQRTSFTLGKPPENIMTGIFAFELGFASVENLIRALKRHETNGKNPVDFVCINQKVYVAYNKVIRDKSTWYSKDDKGNQSPLPSGYVEADGSQECVFRMVLTLSSEAKKNIATAVDFQPYFINGWNVP